jgi:poly(A)-specific ribonuclease
MEVTSEVWDAKKDVAIAAIHDADFIAMDTEMTGLAPEGWMRSTSADSVASRFDKCRHAVQKMAVNQVGICAFKWDAAAGKFIARPFSFYIIPKKGRFVCSVSSSVCIAPLFQDRSPHSHTPPPQADAFHFLASNHFNFNKWVYSGIPFMSTLKEEGSLFRRCGVSCPACTL